jgi:vitamin B12 transporter
MTCPQRKRRPVAHLCVSGLLAAITLQAPAQTPTSPTQPAPAVIESVTVVAEPVPAQTLSGTHTTLNREAIERSGAHDLAELLRFLGVIHLSQSGTKGALSTVSIRAGKPNFTLVLLDGVPMNDIGDLLGGAFNFSTLLADDVQSIDILRGPLSSIYGSEAVDGVISITLRHPADEPLVRFSLEGGNYGEIIASAGVGAVRGRTSGAASGSFTRLGQQVLDDGVRRGTAALVAAVDLGSKARVDSFIHWDRLSTTQFPVSSGGPLYALSRQVERDADDQIAGGIRLLQQPKPIWNSTVAYDLFSRIASDQTPAIFDSIPPGPAYVPTQASDTHFLRQRVLTVQRVQPLHWLMFDALASFRHESGTSVGTLAGVIPATYKLTRPTGFISANGTVRLRGFSGTAGFGLEDSNTYHAVVSPRAGASYTFGETRLRASWGKGFKLPSFYSLGSPLVGNPALTPEFSTGYDAAVEQHFLHEHLNLTLTAFDNSYRNLIDFSPELFRLVNRDSAFGRGAEFEANAVIRRLTLGGSASYDDAGLKAAADRLRDVPRWREDLHLTAPLSSRLRLTVATVWVGRRFDYQVPVPQIDTVPKYSVTNLNLNVKVRDGLDCYVRVENLFDSKYQEFVGFPSPGSYVSAGIQYRLGDRRSLQ